MTSCENITSESFYIEGSKITVKLFELEDKTLSNKFVDRLSSEKNTFYGQGGFHQLELEELKDLCSQKSKDSVGVVALVSKNGQLREVGAARYKKNTLTGSHELAVTVSGIYRLTRLAKELVSFLAYYARNHGVKVLYMIDTDDNVDVRNLAEQLKMSVRLDPNESHKVTYSLNVDVHPGVVEF